MKHCSLESIVDLSRYPLDRAESRAWHELVERKRAELAQSQYCTLPGFLLDDQRRKIIPAIEAGLPQANRADNERNIYLERARTQSLPDDHPKNIFTRGCHSAHRVTPVEGRRRRLMCVMVYENSAGVVGDPVVNETVYGIKAG